MLLDTVLVRPRLRMRMPHTTGRDQMTIYYQDDQTTVYHGDCIEVMRNMPENSVDAIVTDPPYGLGFMGAKWDALPPGKDWAEECLRVLKPGGHLLAFGGTRTWHRLAVAIEDAGFEIRDSVMWLYGSGFPKSHDVGKAIDKAAGHVRGSAPDFRNGPNTNPATKGTGHYGGGYGIQDGTDTGPATPEAEQWDGWGTALKPANEPIVMARKPFKGTVAANVLEHGTGAINIDATRMPGSVPSVPQPVYGVKEDGVTHFGSGEGRNGQMSQAVGGRWPANVILDEHMAGVLDEQSGWQKDGVAVRHRGVKAGMYGPDLAPGSKDLGYGGGGGASRFFYVAKAPKRERPEVNGVKHATVKPLTLMRYLVRMVTPPGGIVLDPFAGSGTTIEAALLEGFQSIGIELTDEYLPLIQQRIQRQWGLL